MTMGTASAAPVIWEPLQQEPAFLALDGQGQERAKEVYRHLIRSSALTAPMHAYTPPAPATNHASSLAERLRAARERVARMRGDAGYPGILPGTAGIQSGPSPDKKATATQEELKKPLTEHEGYIEALLGLPTLHAEGPRRSPAKPAPAPQPTSKPARVLPPPTVRAAAEPPPAASPTVRDPSKPLDRPTLGGAGVTVQPAGEGAWEGIAAGELQPVPWGTVVRTSRTDRGRIVLPGNRGTLHLEPSSEVKLVPGWIRLLRGELRLKVPQEAKTTTEIRTPKGRLKVGPGGDARVRPGGFARVKDPVRRVG